MKRYLILAIFVFFLSITILAHSISLNPTPSNDENKKISQETIAAAYIAIPNFNVLHEENSKTFTVIRNAPIPDSFEGSLLQLKSDDLSDIVMAASNLNVEKIVVFSADKNLARELTQKGYPVLLV